MNIFPMDKVNVGKWTYGDISVYGYNNDNTYLGIGSYCSIAGGHFFIGEKHNLITLTTYLMAVKIYGIESDNLDISKGPVIIGDDV